MSRENEVTSPSERSERVKRFVMFLNDLPDISEYMRYEDGIWRVTTEWLCGAFAGRAFDGSDKETVVSRLIDYLDSHIGHKSMVGNIVDESGWPNLDRVKLYLTQEVSAKAEET